MSMYVCPCASTRAYRQLLQVSTAQHLEESLLSLNTDGIIVHQKGFLEEWWKWLHCEMTLSALSATIIGFLPGTIWGSANTQYKVGVRFSFRNYTLSNRSLIRTLQVLGEHLQGSVAVALIVLDSEP